MKMRKLSLKQTDKVTRQIRGRTRISTWIWLQSSQLFLFALQWRRNLKYLLVSMRKPWPSKVWWPVWCQVGVLDLNPNYSGPHCFSYCSEGKTIHESSPYFTCWYSKYCPIELYRMTKMFYICDVQYGSCVWLLNTGNIVNVIKELIFLNFLFNFN